jgi:hypothetical protein
MEHSDQPHTSNYTNVALAHHIAYLDFGFIEPATLATITNRQTDVQGGPQSLDGTLVTRVAVGVNVLSQLHQQIQHVLLTLGATPNSRTNT